MSIRKSLPIKPRKTVNKTLVTATLLWCAPLGAVELEQLHLPKSYLRYLPQLLDGARLMESSEECHKFLSGTLKLDASSLDHPVFVYACRNSDLLTYRWVVDGLSLDILDSTRPAGRISFADLQAEIDERRRQERAAEAERQRQVAALQAQRIEIERQRQEEQERRRLEEERLREERRRNQVWQACVALWQNQTRNMIEVKQLTLVEPEALVLDTPAAVSEGYAVANTAFVASSEQDMAGPDGAVSSSDHSSDGSAEDGSASVSSDEQGPLLNSGSTASAEAVEPVPVIRFTLDFDALDLRGQVLEYRAYCTAKSIEQLELSIHPRALEEAKGQETAD